MSDEDWKRARTVHRAHVAEPLARRRSSPGKRSLTMSLPTRRASEAAPVQQQAAPLDQRRRTEQAALAEHWMNVAIGPHLHAEPAGAKGTNEQPEQASSASPTGGNPLPEVVQLEMEEASGVDLAIDPPQPGIDKPGFIDNDDGANIRTGPAELQGAALTAQPLPPATRVFVSGQHPQAPQWWYVSAFLPSSIVRGYVQHFRVNTDLPEPSAKLYQIKPGDTAEGLAAEEFSAAVRDGHDLRYYENVLLAVNRDKKRAGVKGTFQDPGILGGGANNIQLEAGRRIWLVSPAYARSLEGKVPDGSLTSGLYAKAKRVLGHLEDIVQSVTDSPTYFAAVAGEYAEAIKDHLPEIIGITAGFILAESASAFLAATPTGVGQLAAVVIQLGLAAFGATVAVDAGVQALQHGQQWLTLAWTAHGDPAQLADASREFLHMLVSIAMAALAIAGVRGNAGKGLQIADAITIRPPMLGWSPAMITPGGSMAAGGPVFTPGSIATTGPVHINPSMMSATGAGGSKVERGESGSTTKPGEKSSGTGSALPESITALESSYAAILKDNPSLRSWLDKLKGEAASPDRASELVKLTNRLEYVAKFRRGEFPGNVTFGKNLFEKLKSHQSDLRKAGAELGLKVEKGKLTPDVQGQMKAVIEHVVKNGEQRIGRYKQYDDALWTRLNDNIVLRQSDGTFITFLKGDSGAALQFSQAGS